MKQYFDNFKTCKKNFCQHQSKKWKLEAKDFNKTLCQKQYKFGTEQPDMVQEVTEILGQGAVNKSLHRLQWIRGDQLFL